MCPPLLTTKIGVAITTVNDTMVYWGDQSSISTFSTSLSIDHFESISSGIYERTPVCAFTSKGQWRCIDSQRGIAKCLDIFSPNSTIALVSMSQSM
jgi:hypothetical protein